MVYVPCTGNNMIVWYNNYVLVQWHNDSRQYKGTLADEISLLLCVGFWIAFRPYIYAKPKGTLPLPNELLNYFCLETFKQTKRTRLGFIHKFETLELEKVHIFRASPLGS